MVLADFEINVEFAIPRSVRVVVYDSLKGLRIAATRYDNVTRSKRRRQNGTFADTLGICHRDERLDHESNPLPLCAIVRLAKPHIGAGMVTHELAHAAVWMRELSGDTSPLTCANDEDLVWLIGELVRQTTVKMYELGVFDAG